jgi:hypothetical protein
MAAVQHPQQGVPGRGHGWCAGVVCEGVGAYLGNRIQRIQCRALLPRQNSNALQEEANVCKQLWAYGHPLVGACGAREGQSSQADLPGQASQTYLLVQDIREYMHGLNVQQRSGLPVALLTTIVLLLIPCPQEELQLRPRG